jgi:hypothetical protein
MHSDDSDDEDVQAKLPRSLTMADYYMVATESDLRSLGLGNSDDIASSESEWSDGY